MKTLKDYISQAIVEHIQQQYAGDFVYANEILNSVRMLLQNDNYALPTEIITSNHSKNFQCDNFQVSLAKINERETRRKKDGVYYTDRDVTDFITANTLLHFADSNQRKVFSYKTVMQKIGQLSNEKKIALLSSSVFDPTCGTGEFLLSAVALKLKIIASCNSFSVLDLVSSIYGNDIEQQSTDITKLRIFFMIVDSLDRVDDLMPLVYALNANFTNCDAVLYDGYTFGKKDIIIGNPPYVEYRNFSGNPYFGYGNVYADVLHHSVDMLNENGIMAFVVPLSYISTIRMAKIREHISSIVNKQIVLNFADRPDCLFPCVHQKLTILIAQKDAKYTATLSSSYNYWYQSERDALFSRISLYPTYTDDVAYWPKLGNKIESDIYRKFNKMSGKCLLDYVNHVDSSKLYLNQRGCFWMKVFMRYINSNSYVCYNVPTELASFAYCAINSSLFFLLWIIISDGWHITNKELSFFKFPSTIENQDLWNRLAVDLENKLEETKAYVGTKQVEYEYKHKFCKDIIDRIDNQLALVYKLSDAQLKYVKGFGLKYRLGDGSNV